MAPQLKKGDKVYLLTKNWKVKKPRTKKLDYVKVRLFSVEERTGPVNIRLVNSQSTFTQNVGGPVFDRGGQGLNR